MSEFIDKEEYVRIVCDCARCDVEDLKLTYNIDLLFHKWMLDRGIDEFKGGLSEMFGIRWEFYKHLYDRRESGVATDLELTALERFEFITEESIKYIDDEDDEAEAWD